MGVTACSSSRIFPVDANFLGERVRTTTDSKIAQYYLEHYLQGEKTNPTLDSKINQLYRQQKQNNKPPTRQVLKKIANDYSVDFAALYLADRLQYDAKNRQIQQNFNQLLENKQSALKTIETAASSYLILFVPGWDYVANGRATGADFVEPRRLVTNLGIENYLVEVPPNGSVSDISIKLVLELEKYSQLGKNIVIVGASSAGPAIYLTLAEKLTKAQQSTIKAWLNLGGILRGSPLIDYYQRFPQNLLFNTAVGVKGWDKEKIMSMSTKVSRARFEKLAGISKDITVINYMGLSLSGQLSIHSKERYPLLMSEGPNDGLTLLADIIAPNSSTIVALGSDHFFAEDPRINEKTIALLKLVIAYIERI